MPTMEETIRGGNIATQSPLESWMKGREMARKDEVAELQIKKAKQAAVDAQRKQANIANILGGGPMGGGGPLGAPGQAAPPGAPGGAMPGAGGGLPGMDPRIQQLAAKGYLKVAKDLMELNKDQADQASDAQKQRMANVGGVAIAAREAIGTPQFGQALQVLHDAMIAEGMPREQVQKNLQKASENPMMAKVILNALVGQTKYAGNLLDEQEAVKKDERQVTAATIETQRAEKVATTKFEREKEMARLESGLKTPKDARTTLQKNLQASGLTPGSKEYQDAMTASLNKKGQTISLDKEGNLVISSGGGAMERPVRTGLQKNIQQKTAGLDRLDEVSSTLDDDFLKVPTRMGATITAMREKFGDIPGVGALMGKVTPEDQKMLADFTKFKTASIDNINLYIKDITGAAMSAEEAKRIVRGMPDPGIGVFDGDSPTVFKSKITQVIRQLKLARARDQYALKNSKEWEKISLAGIEDILRKEQTKFYTEEGWSDDLPDDEKSAVVAKVKQRMRDEYGF